MKKSIVAMLSITALAAVAEPASLERPTGTNFEVVPDVKIGTLLYANNDEYGDNTVTAQTPFFWYASTNLTEEIAQADPSISFADTTSEFGTYTNFFGEYIGNRPDIASQAQTTNRCLLIDTEGGRLFRRICGATDSGEGLNAFQQYSVTNAVYFDSLVQFTVNEDESPTIQTGDKLAVWLKGGDTTNLVITAGYVDDSGSVTKTDYVIDKAVKEVLPGVWYRLTIESFLLTAGADAGNGYIGFRVRIDGDYLTTTQAKMGGLLAECVGQMNGSQTIDEPNAEEWQKLFPSLAVANGEVDNCDTLSCVAFEGTGAVDDLTFTPEDPFAGAAPAVPTVDGVKVDATNVFITARSNKPIVYPTAPTITTNGEGVVSIGFAGTSVNVPEWYNVSSDDGLTVKLSLNNNALPTIGGATVGDGQEAEYKEAIEVGDATFTATLTGTNTKFYYGLKVATAPNAAEENWTLGKLKQGNGGAMQISADKPPTVSGGSDPAPAGFFKVYVTDVNE